MYLKTSQYKLLEEIFILENTVKNLKLLQTNKEKELMLIIQWGFSITLFKNAELITLINQEILKSKDDSRFKSYSISWYLGDERRTDELDNYLERLFKQLHELNYQYYLVKCLKDKHFQQVVDIFKKYKSQGGVESQEFKQQLTTFIWILIN